MTGGVGWDDGRGGPTTFRSPHCAISGDNHEHRVMPGESHPHRVIPGERSGDPESMPDHPPCQKERPHHTR